MCEKQVIVFGNRSLAELTYFHLTHDSPYEVAGFTVDPEYIEEDALCGLPIAPFDGVESIFPPDEYNMLVAVSFQQMNRVREEKYYQAKAKGYHLVSYVSSSTTTWPGLIIGDNCLVQENSVIQPCVEIGSNVIIGPGVVIGHHSVIRDHSFIAPGVVILGDVTVGPYCFIGANSTIKEKTTVAEDCLVGAGVSIVRDTRERGVYIGGSPKPLSKPSNELRTWLTYAWSSR